MSECILVVDDEIRYRQLYVQTLAAAGFETLTAGSTDEALALIERRRPALVVSDVRMPGADGIVLLRIARDRHPDLPFLLVTAYADVHGAVEAMKLGAVDYLPKPVDLDELLAAVRDALGVQTPTGEPGIPPEAMKNIVAESPAMRAVLRDAYRVARSDANVLLVGESGSGKEVLAVFIHRNSARHHQSLVAVNCAAIPAALLASELFGHERGAFTGAVEKRRGRFREADGGTLFLDEIGEMPTDLQAALLRAIESGRIRPVGGDREIEVDYRLIAATNRDLRDDVHRGRFRQDLYYRLNVITIEIPPLRQRPDDILPLARFFLRSEPSPGKRLSRAAVRALRAHNWPGNVRELANAMEHARLLCQTDLILPEHLPPVIREAAARGLAERSQTTPDKPDEPTGPAEPAEPTSLEESELKTIRRALAQTGGNRTRAAAILGITRRGLIYKLKRLGMD